MKPGTSFLITGVLGFFIFLSYLALGLASRLTPLWQALLWLAFAATATGLVAGLKGRRQIAFAAWGLAGLILVGQQVGFEMSLSESRAPSPIGRQSGCDSSRSAKACACEAGREIS